MRLTIPLSAVLLVALALPASAQAAKKEKRDEEISVFKREKVDDPDDQIGKGPSGPRLRARDMVRVFQAKAQAKRDQAIRRLKEIIQDTPNDDPDKPDYFFRLSELFWGKANFYTLRAYGYDDEIWKTEKSDPARHEQLKRLKQEDLERAREYRSQTLEVYEAIRKHFADYAKMDSVLFYMGFNYKEIGEAEKAQGAFIELIKRFPRSKFLADAWLAFGEFFFDIDEMDRAQKAYDKAAKFKDPKTYGFAVYKRGWCNYNLGRYKEALKDFLAVIEFSDGAKPGEKSKISLRSEATKDVVTVYAQIGTGAKAIPFFKKVAPKRWAEMAFKLAKLYSNTGKVKDANDLYRRLIRLNKDKPEIIEYEFAIARNVETIGEKEATTLEVKRLVTLFFQMRESGRLEGSKLEAMSRKIREMLRELSTTWHREAQVTKNDSYLSNAHQLYSLYVETFPDADDVYVMTFYLAELLFRTGEWEKSAKAYDRVITLNPKGKYARDAAHAAVLAYQKLLDLSEREGSQARKAGAPGARDKSKKPEKCPPEPKEIAGAAQDFLRACDNYIRMVPDGDRITDVQYFAALIYYDHDHFDEAIKRFKAIIQSHPKHRLAYYSASLEMDCYALKCDMGALNRRVEELVKIPEVARGKLLEDLQGLREGAKFKECLGKEAEKEHEEAASCFVHFTAEFPTSEFFDKALYNAALNFEKFDAIEKAIAARMKLLRERPDSELANKALFAIAGNLHASAVYSQAAKYYVLFAKQFPDDPNAEIALANAAVFYRGLGQYDTAVSVSEEWVRRYSRKKATRAAEVVFSIGEVYEKEERWRDAIKQYSDFLRRWAKKASDDKVLQAHTKIGLAHLQMGRSKDAARAFDKSVKVFKGLNEAKRKKLIDGREAAAHARFMQGKDLFDDYSTFKITNVKKIVKQVQEKLKKLVAAKAVFDSVVLYAHPNWAIAAIAHNGLGFEELAKAVREAPAPPGLNEEEEMVYRDELDQQAEQFDSKAAENYVQVLALASKFQWFNSYSKLAEERLQVLRPDEYTLSGEQVAAPEFRSEGFRSANFRTKRLKK